MNNEMMATTTPEAEKVKPVSETMTFVDTKKMAEEAIANNAELTIAKKVDQAESNKKINELTGEIKDLKSPEEKSEIINKRIQELQEELAEKERDYKNLTTTSSYSNGVGGLNFVGGTAVESLKKYPGVERVVGLLATAAEKNKEKKTTEKADGILGKLGVYKKDKELHDREYQVVKNVLLTGSIAESGENLLRACKVVTDFLKANDPEMLKTAKYQDILNAACKHDEKFRAENQHLLIDKKVLSAEEQEKLNNIPASVKDAMAFERTVGQISELKKTQQNQETPMKLAA